MSIFAVLDVLHATHYRILYNLFHLWSKFVCKNIGALFLLKIVGKLLLEEHITLYMRICKIFMISSYRIVRQMDKFVLNVLRIIVLGRKSDIAFIIKPDG